MKITVGIGATRANTIEAAARSIIGQTWPDWELLIVGQGRAAGEQARALQGAGERLAACDARIKYVHLQEMGLSRARNEVSCRATGEVIAFTDDDCEADPEWLATIAGCLQADPSIGLVGGALIGPPAAGFSLSTCPVLTPAEVLYDPSVDPETPPGWDWVGANVALRAAVAARVGPFDEFLGAGAAFAAGEETDYKLRLEALRVCMLATPRAVVHHTYGRRVRWAAVTRSSRSYARGAGAVAGKLTLAGDPRGMAWVRAARRQFRRDLLTPTRSLAAIYRLPHFLRAYREVVEGYIVDAQTRCLQPKSFEPGRSVLRGGA